MKKLIGVHYKFLLSKLHNGEHHDFFSRGIIEALAHLMIIAIISVKSRFLSLNTVFEREKAIFKKSEASFLTPEITLTISMARDYFIFLRQSVAINKYSKDPDVLSAMNLILFLLKTYEPISEANYTDLSGLLENLLQDCNSTAYKPSIQLLGLTDQITRLTATYTSFRAIYTERALDKEQIAELGKLKDVRIEVDNAFEIVVSGINDAWITNELVDKDPAVRSSLLEMKEIIVSTIHQTQLNLAHRGVHSSPTHSNPQSPDINLPDAPNTPPQTPNVTPPTINPDDLNPPAVGEH